MSYFVQCPLLEPTISLVDVDALYYRTKLSGDCFCSKICLLYSLVSGLAGMPTQ